MDGVSVYDYWLAVHLIELAKVVVITAGVVGFFRVVVGRRAR